MPGNLVQVENRFSSISEHTYTAAEVHPYPALFTKSQAHSNYSTNSARQKGGKGLRLHLGFEASLRDDWCLGEH